MKMTDKEREAEIARLLTVARQNVARAASLDPTNAELDLVWNALVEMTD